MIKFRDLIANSEDWLTERVIKYAREYNYTKYSSTLKEAWRIAISGMSDTILKALDDSDQPPAIGPDLDYNSDLLANFGILEARKHRARGISLGMFLGGLVCYRQAYIDLVRQAGFSRADEEHCRLFLERVFDRVAIAFGTEWTDTEPNELVEVLQTSNRNITNEKNKYLTICESLPNPVIVFDQNNQIDSMNYAAMALFEGKCVPGQHYYTKNNINIGIPWLTAALNAVAAGNYQQNSLEKQLVTKDAVYFFEIRFKPLLDISGKFSGTVVILNDITGIKIAEQKLRLAYQELDQVFTTAGDGMRVIDTNFNVVRINDAFAALIGVSKEEAVGKKCYDLFYGNHCNTNDCPMFRISGGEERIESDVLKERADGVRIPCIITTTPLRSTCGELIGIIENVKDITERKQAEDALKKGEERFRLLAENAMDIVYRAQLYPEQKFEYVSPAVSRITGYEPGEFYADPLLSKKILYPADRSTWKKVVNGNFDYANSVTVRWLRKDGGVIWVEHRNVPFYDDQNRLVALEGIARDITERKLMEEQLIYLSFHDSLTGLYNRAFFELEMQRLDDGRHHPVGIIICDIDDLKLINDSMGHSAGDEALVAAARVLKKSFRESDIVARIGGDEFAVLLQGSDLETAEKVCRRIKDAQINKSLTGSELKVSMSIGFAVSDARTSSLTDVFKEADNNMYREKSRHKKGTACVASVSDHSRAH